jgi:shikimate kinase/3-dehydroquinate synthase
MVTRLVLIGFSGTGKSTVSRLAAGRLGWSLLDMDAEIEQREGMSIPQMFSTRGETAFRDLERAVFLEALDWEEVVIATGGGAVCTEEIWRILDADPSILVVGLDASPEILLKHLTAHEGQAAGGETTKRPLLDTDDPLSRIRCLKADREPFYRRADVTMAVGHRLPESTADDIAELVRLANGTASAVTLDLPQAASSILVGRDLRNEVAGLLLGQWPKAQRVWIAADAAVHRHHATWLTSLEHTPGVTVHVHDVPSGESSKSIGGVSDLYNWMIGGGVERGDVAVALGGGVTGDVMGFAAATVLRGIGLMQVPTTLLSMVDSSVGGKTGINHPGGKNLIGAFYQPALVVVDPAFLVSLPPRELRSGFAEIIKHGVIQASTPGGENGFLLDVLEANTASLLTLKEPLTSWVVRQNVSLKASVVREDEKESHLRAILNFGHTIGHGVEAAGYALLHGEAVAVGMVAAMTIAVEKGLVSDAVRERLVRLLEAYQLPTMADVDTAMVRARMARDKKKASGEQQWVLPVQSGGVEIRTDVMETEIDLALAAITGR